MKTTTALNALQRVVSKNPTVITVIIVPTKLLKEQWIAQLKRRNLTATVIVINTAAKRSFKCDFLILDEIQHYSSSYFSKVFQNCNPTFILGLTGTYERLDGLEKQIVDKICPVFDTVTIEEATKNGWLSPYKEYKVMLQVDLTPYNNANRTFLEHFAFFNFEWDDAMKAVQDINFRRLFAKRMNCTEKEVTAHAFAWNKAMQFRKKFISDHPKKIEVAKKIIEARSDRKIITFNSSIKQCEAYGFGYVIHSEQKKKDNDRILTDFSNTDSGVLHTSKMVDEGADIPGVSIAIVTGFNSSKITAIQRIGRIIRREEGKEAEVFFLVLQGAQDGKWFQKAHEGMSYIQITEEELDKLLSGEELHKSSKIGETFNGLRY